ncbi:HAD-IA family hydrolase [Falsochrobactrum sp. TDYN1]|uniref:HAD-IA family hydrolase n=1 Tax=Falsochrobactrum tianjinense TaxID=2706015 RepID=A0A949PNB1_9HYPH|nr:HAD-IA family hydrolase [Falsochrobactrum sp. TDYN1]MBV2143614.1 HAD-IA family hydrolase [Falsochrobactrum sp. TDYN1]
MRDTNLADILNAGTGNIGLLDNIDLVIFDCDGVLINSEPIASRTLAEMLQEAGVPISAEEAHVRFTGSSESIIRAVCEKEYNITDIAARFENWHARLFDEFARSLEPMPGIIDVVTSIDRPKCVASNSTLERLRKSLGRLTLWNQFNPDIFSAEMVARPKPAPDLLQLCAEKFGARPEHCVMIDDSPHGVSAAVAAGMVAVGFVDPFDPRPGRASLLSADGALHVVEGATELPAALQSINDLLGKG